MNKSDLDYIYNISCPICGKKPFYKITGTNKLGQITSRDSNVCGHKELDELIDQRESFIQSRYRR
jgi:hypothetical protein